MGIRVSINAVRRKLPQPQSPVNIWTDTSVDVQSVNIQSLAVPAQIWSRVLKAWPRLPTTPTTTTQAFRCESANLAQQHQAYFKIWGRAVGGRGGLGWFQINTLKWLHQLHHHMHPDHQLPPRHTHVGYKVTQAHTYMAYFIAHSRWLSLVLIILLCLCFILFYFSYSLI